jgi:hypothetical protein
MTWTKSMDVPSRGTPVEEEVAQQVEELVARRLISRERHPRAVNIAGPKDDHALAGGMRRVTSPDKGFQL